jgi:hypothetical protein
MIGIVEEGLILKDKSQIAVDSRIKVRVKNCRKDRLPTYLTVKEGEKQDHSWEILHKRFFVVLFLFWNIYL